MQLLNPWRLALLFFISGVAICFASDKLPTRGFAVSRLKRLGFPILFGWSSIVLLLSLAQRWLSLDTPVLRYLNEAIFAYYCFTRSSR